MTEPELASGDSGEHVEQLQNRLLALGRYSGTVDGRFAEQTEAAVQQLQTDAGLAADGRVGPQTWAALRDAEAAAGILTAASDHASMAVGDLSEDQQWRWDGKQWEPAETNAALAFAPEQVADGHVSTDGHWRWDGSSWQPVG